jgi:hypothetical protein
MLRNFRRNFEIIQLLLCNRSRIRTHHEMHLVHRTVDLLEQALQIDRSACARRSDYQFHMGCVIPSGAKRNRGIPRSNRTVGSGTPACQDDEASRRDLLLIHLK